MKIKLIFISLIFIFFLYQGAAVAATGDVIDNFQFSSTACKGYANAVWADVDGINNGETYGNYETMVVFWTITGEAYPVNESIPPGKWYFFSPYDTHCGGTEPWDRAKLRIRFVDMLAPGFDQTDPTTWVWKDVKTVSLKTSHDECVATGIPLDDAFMSVQAFSDIEQNGIITDYT
jgi:hypothetical protein